METLTSCTALLRSCSLPAPSYAFHLADTCWSYTTVMATQEFQELWAEYDDGSGTIAPEQLQALLTRTDPPLGLGRTATGRDVLKFVFNLDIPLVNGRVPFHRTVYELVRNVSETQIPEVHQAVCQWLQHVAFFALKGFATSLAATDSLTLDVQSSCILTQNIEPHTVQCACPFKGQLRHATNAMLHLWSA